MKGRIQEVSGRTLRQAAPLVALLAAVWMAYYPSLGHAPRADQWCFLLDTVGQDHFSTLFAHTYSYNRTRVVSPGDYLLFRPVLFALLSGEKALFGNNFACWQATGIILHCVALCLLLRLMLRITTLLNEEPTTEAGGRWISQETIARAVSFALVLYFGLNCTVVEMVIWAHINGYILFVVLVLGSMLLLLDGIVACEKPGSKGVWLLSVAWLLTLLSAFTYELGQFYAVIAGTLTAAAIYRKGEARRATAVFAMFFGILLLYRTANRLDQRAHAGRDPDVTLALILDRMTFPATLAHTERYLLYNVVQPFFPACVAWSFTNSRLVILETVAERWNDWRSSPTSIISSVLLVGMASLTVIGGRRLVDSKHRKIGLVAALLAFSLAALHLAVTVVGRMNLRPGPGILSTNSYYPYIPLLFLILGAFAVWQGQGARRQGQEVLKSNLLSILVFTAVLILSFVSGIKVHAINAKGRDDFAVFTRRIATVEHFIRQHRSEADFSMAFTFDSCQSLGVQNAVPVTTILFQPYLSSSCPKYVVSFPEGEPSITPFEEWRASRSPSRYLCPELVSVGRPYMFYRVGGRYYGVLFWDGCYDPSRRDHAYLIEGATLEEAQHQQAAKMAEQHADIQAGRFVPPVTSASLVEEGYKGFNLIEAAGTIYAIPQGEGSFDMRKIRAHGYTRFYAGESTAEVKAQIDRSGRFIPPSKSVLLVEEGYKGFNLIEAAGALYAIPQGEGTFDLDRVRKLGYSRSYVGVSPAEVKAQIDGTNSRSR